MGTGFSHKYKNKYNNVRCEVIAHQARVFKVMIKDGEAAGTTHKYFFKDFRLDDPLTEPGQSASEPSSGSGADPVDPEAAQAVHSETEEMRGPVDDSAASSFIAGFGDL